MLSNASVLIVSSPSPIDLDTGSKISDTMSLGLLVTPLVAVTRNLACGAPLVLAGLCVFGLMTRFGMHSLWLLALSQHLLVLPSPLFFPTPNVVASDLAWAVSIFWVFSL